MSHIADHFGPAERPFLKLSTPDVYWPFASEVYSSIRIFPKRIAQTFKDCITDTAKLWMLRETCPQQAEEKGSIEPYSGHVRII